MDANETATAGTATTVKRQWVCELDLDGGWRQYGQGTFGSLDGVRRMWRLQATAWRVGTVPRARARNRVTGEFVAL